MNIDLLHNIKNSKIIVFGDYMVDEYLIGNVNRISPEAPVPVIEVTKETRKLGGAGNVIDNIISLGGNVKAIGCIGKDEPGDFIIDHFKNNNVNISFFKQYKKVSTIIKTRVVSKNQQFLRIDEEKKEPILDEFFEFVKDNVDKLFKDQDVLIISDYAKGAVSEKISQFLIKESKKRNIPVIVDPKGNDYSKYKGATMITPNLKELSDLYNIKITSEQDIIDYGGKLCNDIDLKYLVLTRSEKGISVIDKNKVKRDYPAMAKEVIDVSGAGDTVVATVALLLSLNYSIDDICKLANLAASVVVSKFGTATVTLNELISTISNSGDFKIQDVHTLKYIVADLKEKGKKVVFTNGCFDIFHVGHLNLIKRAKQECDYLIVGVHPSAAHKGKETFIPLEERKAIVASCKYVDKVVDSTPEDSDSWSLYHYDKLFVGSDYKGTERFKRYEEYFKDKGVTIVYFPYTKSTSSTQIRAMIMKETNSTMEELKRN